MIADSAVLLGLGVSEFATVTYFATAHTYERFRRALSTQLEAACCPFWPNLRYPGWQQASRILEQLSLWDEGTPSLHARRVALCPLLLLGSPKAVAVGFAAAAVAVAIAVAMVVVVGVALRWPGVTPTPLVVSMSIIHLGGPQACVGS